MSIRKQPFGRTGHESSVTLFGGASLVRVTQADADRTLAGLLENGINHIDTAAGYGESELRIAPWMKQHRKDFFLATKTSERTYAAAKAQIAQSLERLEVEVLDLIQLHNLGHPDEWETAMGEGGALEAALEARDQKRVRFIGVTGHGLNIAAMHRRSLERFDFDSVLFPWNFLLFKNAAYRRDVEALLQICRQRNVAVQTIKSIARGPWADTSPNRTTWYHPLEDQADIDVAVHWTLGQPGLFLNTVADIDLLPKVLNAASRFQHSPADEVMEALIRDRQITSLFVS